MYLRPLACWFNLIHVWRCRSQVKVEGHGENVARVVGATSSDAFSSSAMRDSEPSGNSTVPSLTPVIKKLTKSLHCKNSPYIHGHFVASFPYFNWTVSVYMYFYVMSVNRRNIEARAHIANVHIRIFLQCMTAILPSVTLNVFVRLECSHHSA